MAKRAYTAIAASSTNPISRNGSVGDETSDKGYTPYALIDFST